MIRAIFKSALPSFSYHFKNGMTAVFTSGRYETGDKKLIEELAEEVGEIGKGKSKHPYIFVDENEQEIDTEALSPLEVIKLQAKEEARQELLAEQAAAQAAALDPSNSVSTSTSGEFKDSVANTTTIAEGAVGSTGDSASSVASRLAAMSIGKPSA